MSLASQAPKPRIEDALPTALSPEKAALALDFVTFLRQWRMSPQWASANSWAVSCKGKRVCYIKITSSGAWYIRPAVLYDETLRAFCQQEGLTGIMLNSVHHCTGCGKCAPGKTAVFFGQTLEHVCCSPIDFEFHDPDDLTLDCAKKIILYRRNAIMAASKNSKGR